MAFLPNCDMALARTLVAGPDVWLNTPQPPAGSIGNKRHEGRPERRAEPECARRLVDRGLDGAIGRDGAEEAEQHARAFYNKREKQVLPLYYQDSARWVWMMKRGISKIASYFNSQRMVRRYATETYVRL
jgi:starch phosphorylase